MFLFTYLNVELNDDELDIFFKRITLDMETFSR